MANIFPKEAKNSAVYFAIPLSSAKRNATSELNGKRVAAKKALRKRLSSAIEYSIQLKR